MKIIWWIIGIVAVISALVVAVIMAPSNVKDTNEESTTDTSIVTTDSETDTASVDGRYVDYSADFLSDKSYDSTIIFFYAPWCPECRGFDMVIKEGLVPKNTQILKLDYDSSQDLRKKYGVTIQTSFVRVDSSGNKQRLWSGYGKDKSIDAIIENTK